MLFKLLLMTLPLAIFAVILGIYSGVSQLSVLNESRHVFYEELAGIIDDVLACDRDFYQSQLGSDRAHILEAKGDEAGVKEALDDYDGNKQQVYDGLASIDASAKNDPYLYNTFRMDGQTDSLANQIALAKSKVDAWAAIYDPHSGSGDYDSQYASFLEARGIIGDFQDIAEEYGNYLNKKMQAEIRNKIIILMVLIIVVIVFIAFLTVLVLRYILVFIVE